MIIGFAGKMGSGKDTAGSYLVEEYGYERISFADKLKKSAAACFGIDPLAWEYLKNDPHACFQLFDGDGEIVTQVSVREFLQKYGTEAHREIFRDDFWVWEALKDMKSDKNYVITDVRFKNEAAAIRAGQGIVVQIERGERVPPSHASEEGLPPDLIDAIVQNNGSIEDLRDRLDFMFDMVKAGQRACR